MSSFERFEQAVGSVLALRGVKRCIVVSKDQDSLQARKAEALPRTILVLARDLALSLLETKSERRDEQLLGHLVVTRRIEDVAMAVIGDDTLDAEEVHRKLNVIAIRVQASSAKEAPSPLAVALREAYVSVAGLLSGMVFDRAFDELKRTHKTIDGPTLRAFAETLAESLTPPTNHFLRERFQQAMSTWDTPSGSFKAAAATAATAAAAPRPGTSAPTLRRPTTVPRMVAVQQVVRELIGPFGDLLVQRALQSNLASGGSAETINAADTEKLITTIAGQLPAQHRARFMVESRAAIDGIAAPTSAANAESERGGSASAGDDQRPQRE